jgi:hypothetical protein
MEVAVGLEPTKTGFAGQRLDHFGIATPEKSVPVSIPKPIARSTLIYANLFLQTIENHEVRLIPQGFADLCLTTWRPRHRIRKESSPQALALAIRFFPGKL